MDFVNNNKTIGTFPFDSIRGIENAILSDSGISKDSYFSVRSYDNRGRISDITSSLSSKLGFLQTRFASSSFLSDTFSWQVKTAITSDSDSILAKASSEAEPEDFSIEIDKLATARTATSKKLASDDMTEFETGVYSYDLTIGTDTYSIDFDITNDIGAPESNRSVLLDLERSINNLGVGVEAELYDAKVKDYNPYSENAYKDISYLVVSSETTGEEIDFSLADTNGSLIEDLSLNKVTNLGRKNQYRINGVQDQSDSNNIVVKSDQVSAYLLDTTDEDENLQISVKQDFESLASELVQVINEYNEFINWIDDNNSVINSNLKKTLFNDISSPALEDDETLNIETNNSDDNELSFHIDFASTTQAAQYTTIDAKLIDIGLTLNNDGTIDISDDFSASLAGNMLDTYNTLAGTNGFFTRISEAIDTIYDKNESRYVSSYNSILSYDANGTARQSIYQDNGSAIINLFA